MKSEDFKKVMAGLSKDLEFNEYEHKYTINGVKLTSVTTWLGGEGGGFNPYVESERLSNSPGSEYFGLTPKAIRDIWNSNARRGTLKHKQVENWFNKLISDDEFKSSEWFKKKNLTPINCVTELKVFSKKYMLAGTLDLLQIIPEDDYFEFAIWDLKTSKSINSEKMEHYSMQILTYCLLLREMLNDNQKIKIVPRGVIHYEPKISLVDENVDWDDVDVFYKPYIIPFDKSILEDFKEMLATREKDIKNKILVDEKFNKINSIC